MKTTKTVKEVNKVGINYMFGTAANDRTIGLLWLAGLASVLIAYYLFYYFLDRLDKRKEKLKKLKARRRRAETDYAKRLLEQAQHKKRWGIESKLPADFSNTEEVNDN